MSKYPTYEVAEKFMEGVAKDIEEYKRSQLMNYPWINTPESSNVLRFCYAMAKLIVDFQNGSEYAYFVPPSYYIAMNKAPSKGKFVHNELRKANKPYRLIRGPFKKPIGEVRREVPYRTEPGRPRRKLEEEVMRGPFKEKAKWEGGEEW